MQITMTFLILPTPPLVVGFHRNPHESILYYEQSVFRIDSSGTNPFCALGSWPGCCNNLLLSARGELLRMPPFLHLAHRSMTICHHVLFKLFACCWLSSWLPGLNLGHCSLSVMNDEPAAAMSRRKIALRRNRHLFCGL
jgi:hypothetical protein